MTVSAADAAVARGLQTEGTSDAPIYERAAALLRARAARGMLVDVGCGIGQFFGFTRDLATSYVGVDVVRHPGLAPEAQFLRADLDREAIPLPAATADIVVALETIEHLENPHQFVRELARILAPGGWLVLSTPNQLSLLSLLSLVVRGRYVAFQDSYYPIHRTALLPIDLVRVATECGCTRAELAYSHSGRMPLTGAHYPRGFSQLFPQALSDNVLVIAQRSASHG